MIQKLVQKKYFSSSQRSWFDKINVGAIESRNRIFLASLTRMRADKETGVGNDMIIEYYKQRAASFGILFTEASQISKRGRGYRGACDLITPEQVQFWKKCVSECHKLGTKFIAQLWHVGRATHSSVNGGFDVVSSSPIAINLNHPFVPIPYPVPKEMTLKDIEETMQEYYLGAKNAKEAGFDGVELHGANGYLPDQFLKNGINHRKDKYGGSIENRCRFVLEAIDQLIKVYGSDRVGIKLTPTGRFLEAYDTEPIPLYNHLIKELDKRNIAFIQMKEPGDIDQIKHPNAVSGKAQIANCSKQFRHLFKGTLITNDGFEKKVLIQEGFKKIQSGDADAMTFGKLGINNPDLPIRIQNNYEIDYKFNPATFYSDTAKGYTDYPFYKSK